MSGDREVFPVRVYYEDTDFSGNVYHAAYAKFMERARTEFLRNAGVHHSELLRSGLVFVVRRLSMVYHRPAHIDDELLVVTETKDLRGARILLEQMVFRGDDLLVSGEVEVALADARGRPRRFPPEMAAKLKN